MDRLFDLDNGFFRFMGKMFDMMVLNILCIITCIPIVTIGPSVTALYYVSMKLVRDEEGYVVRGFFKAFRENFKKAFIIELIVAVCAAILYVDLTVTYNWMKQDTGLAIRLLFYALVGLALLAVVSVVYVFPVLAKFENTVKKIIINSIMMSVRHLSWSFLMVVVTVAAGVAVYIYPVVLFFIVGAVAFINSIILRRIFDNYIHTDTEGKVIEGNDIEEEVIQEEVIEETQEQQNNVE